MDAPPIDFDWFIRRALQLIRRDAVKRLRRIPMRDEARETYVVVGGLLCRQHDLTVSLVRDSLNWNPCLAPLVHRAMAEVRITLGYVLLADTAERCTAYIQYGLGQEKLQIEHYEAEIAAGDYAPSLPKHVENRKAWLAMQQHEWLTTVNLGAQFDRPIRSIAIAADLKDLYDYNYTAFSAATHSTWLHVGKYNAAVCPEPLHGWHLIPQLGSFDNAHPFDAAVAVKNFDYTLKAVDKWIGKRLKGEAKAHFEKYLPLHALAADVLKHASGAA